jgi:putative transposase
VTLLAYRFALDPTPAQERALRSHAGAARVAFNWGLARVRVNLSQREAEKSYGITGDDLTPTVSWSLFSLRKDWNAVKATVAPWWGECSKEAFNTGLDQLARALKNWSASRRGTRKGRAMGFPRFRSRRRARPGIRFTTGAVRCQDGCAVLPRIGRIRLHETDRPVQGRILAASVRYERGRWFVSFTVERDPLVGGSAASEPDAVVGVDLGIKVLAVLSTGEVVANPKPLQRAQRHLRRLSRRLSRRRGRDRRSGQVPSRRWERAAAALGKAHGRVADLRRDAQHKFTTDLSARYGTVVVEDLNVAGMVRNRRLARAVSDAGFSEIRRQVEYKSAWRGGRVIVADRWFASSKTCSGCGVVRAKLLLSERTYICVACGLVIDRDENAAQNLAEYGRRILSGSGSESNGRGADQKTGVARQVAVKLGAPPACGGQPGTAQADQTGTVPAARHGTATKVSAHAH